VVEGVADLGVRAEITPSPVWDAFIAYRPLWLESATDTFAATLIRDRTGRSGTFAGHQIEGRLRYWIIPNEMILDWLMCQRPRIVSLCADAARPAEDQKNSVVLR
jgi:hypothetical protein